MWRQCESGKLAAQSTEGTGRVCVSEHAEMSTVPETPPIDCSAAAKRMRAHRERRRKGLRCFTLQIREREIDVLVQRGFLHPDTRNDPYEVAMALYRPI
jgi:hypothetical protein